MIQTKTCVRVLRKTLRKLHVESVKRIVFNYTDPRAPSTLTRARTPLERSTREICLVDAYDGDPPAPSAELNRVACESEQQHVVILVRN